jgi:small subunit ribosomal protein S18
MSKSSSTKPRPKSGKESTKKIKKKISILVQEGVDYVDYKDVNLLQRFLSDRSKIRARRVTGNDVQQQRDIAMAIKNAREMALLPYTRRVSTTRGPKSDRGDRGERGSRGPREEAPEVEEAVAAVDDLEVIEAVEAEA